MELIRNFSQINKKDAALAGGKGASLGEMTGAGIPVPPGFVVLASAFEKFLTETDLNAEIDASLETVDHQKMHTVAMASEKIQSLILSVRIPDDIQNKIRQNFKNLNAKLVAVRSSATAEDSVSNAWAGQLDTFLNTTEKTLLENIQKCWASLFTPRAIFYRFEKGLHQQKISVAVVVQKMIQSEIAGIAFSVHPVTEDENQMIIEAGWGLGEAVVSGQITPDAYVVDKQDWSILDINVNQQDKFLTYKTDGGNYWQALPARQKEAQKLTSRQIIELAKLVTKIEKHYRFPVDVEWAFARPEPAEGEKGKFYITQSRPITTLGK